MAGGSRRCTGRGSSATVGAETKQKKTRVKATHQGDPASDRGTVRALNIVRQNPIHTSVARFSSHQRSGSPGMSTSAHSSDGNGNGEGAGNRNSTSDAIQRRQMPG